MKILVTGAHGQLGHDLVKELNLRGHDVVGADLAECDITDEAATLAYIRSVAPDAVIHCAAFTAVDAAEDNRELCLRVNGNGTENVAKACADIGAKLLYISTDYVFPGNGDTPWKPEDRPDPINYYGYTKYLGEQAVCKYVPRHFIVRISWAFGKYGKNFVATMLRLGAQRDVLTVVDDQIGSPTYTPDLSVLLTDMIVTEKYGVYHATNEGICSWYEFACAIMEAAGLPAKILPVSSAEYGAKAARPANSRMSKEKLDEMGFRRLPSWRDALARYLEERSE